MTRRMETLPSDTTQASGFETDSQKWDAVVARDSSADGAFFFAVETTGVYCRPSCGARQPRRENVGFYLTAAAAERAGYRPCKRCKPNESQNWAEKAALVERACRFIEEAETPPSLAEISAAVGLSRYHFHRLFKDVTGITPKAYATAHRAERIRGALRDSGSITEAIYDAGYNANSRFYDKAGDLLGMAASAYRAGGKGQVIRYTIRACSLGLMLLGATERGVCTIQFGDRADDLVARLEKDFPSAVLNPDGDEIRAWVDAALALVDCGETTDIALPLDIQGTAFQQKVWKALQDIPPGTTASYADIAERIAAPTAARAVARACGQNRLGVVVPCHRVIRKDGSLGGYRWGEERKRRLLKRESKG